MLVLVAAWGLLREATHVLLEGTPKRLDAEEVASVIAAAPGVVGVHHLHLWSLASDIPALSAHVVVGEDVTMHEAQRRGAAVRAALLDRFGIDHATLELECHTCEPPT
jgi:cobalt-zinc-cadmium efflux system protein